MLNIKTQLKIKSLEFAHNDFLASGLHLSEVIDKAKAYYAYLAEDCFEQTSNEGINENGCKEENKEV